jgi:hypothetical protein
MVYAAGIVVVVALVADAVYFLVTDSHPWG